MKICIVGLGYVGLPLALQFARSGANVLGLDIDAGKVESINRGESYIRHIAKEAITEQLRAGRLEAATDFNRLSGADAVIICVPTPLNRNRKPDISFIVETARAIAPHLSKGTLVVLESTTHPGTTDGNLRPSLKKSRAW